MLAIAAAAAVVTVAAAAAQAAPVPRGTGPAAGAVPPFYVALAFTGDGDCCRPGQPESPATDAVVEATLTGRVLATVPAPRPYQTFTLVSGAAGDRVFALAAQRLATITKTGTPPLATQFYLLRIRARGAAITTRLARLPITTPGGLFDSDMSLSPDASALAVTTVPVRHPFNSGILRIYQTATGAVKRWYPGDVGTGFGDQSGSSLSWQANGRTLGFIRNGVRLLDTAAAGSNLLTASRLAVPSPHLTPPFWRQAVITPDGRTVLAALEIIRPHSLTQQMDSFCARTGKLEHVLNRLPVSGGQLYEQVQWSSPSGNVLLISGARHGPRLRHAAFYMSSIGVLARSRYTPLPWSARTFMAAW
jgi:hypothetical protein